jgi:hypothetical protein
MREREGDIFDTSLGVLGYILLVFAPLVSLTFIMHDIRLLLQHT